MNFTELVKMRGFDILINAKLVRHQEKEYDIRDLHKAGYLEFYQSIQSKDIFSNCDYIFSFIGEEGTKATFVGAYKRKSTQKFDKSLVPAGYPLSVDEDLYYYDFEKIRLLEDMVDRLVIDWGKSTRGWHQWLNSDKQKEVIEILPLGYTKDFPGYDDLLLTFDELSSIIKNKDANRIWHLMLGSVAGVYLIVDTVTGLQYVGSAYGEDGILGRWKAYVDTKHGGNKILTALVQDDPERCKKFQFSILQTLPRSMNKDEVIRKEQVYKQKLGTRAFGLNDN